MLAQAVNAFVTAGRCPLKSHRTEPARRKTSLRSGHIPVSPIGGHANENQKHTISECQMKTIIYLVVVAGLLLGIGFVGISALGAIEKIVGGHTTTIMKTEQEIGHS